MSDLRELYQQMILDHARQPRNFKPLDNPTHKAEGYNPLCGDKLTVHANVENGIVKNISFEGAGCAISTASASMMTESAKGKTVGELDSLIHRFQELVTGQSESQPDPNPLGKLVVFKGVCEYPTRVKCATLAWHALKNALVGKKEAASTE